MVSHFPTLSLTHTLTCCTYVYVCIFMHSQIWGGEQGRYFSRSASLGSALSIWPLACMSSNSLSLSFSLFLFFYIYHTRTRTHLTDLYYHKSVRNLSTASTTICRYVFIYVYLHLSCRWSQNIIIKMLPLFVDLWNLFKFPRFLY